ncbi:conserved hypothetical protein [Moraxellaceae bacterium 17A]|jgi:hypothetical protein|nr:conserved hypothetical protein [Moraxellaceae bacterium 17A]
MQEILEKSISQIEEARRRKAWERAMVSSQLEGVKPNSLAQQWMELYFKGKRSEEATFKGLMRIAKGLPPA